jgi:Zn-dependent protease with chaperone function
MNFFESQERARKSTALLVGLFALAVLGLIVMANLLVMLVFGLVDGEQLRDGATLLRQMDWPAFAAVSAGVGVVVLAGSLYRMLTLSAGGKAVAESLGGRLIPRDTRDMNQRRLLNVVDEMAIASGTPAPPVYLLAHEPGINAFAAGFSPRDAVIGVTRGAVDHLSREHLQGVIAHEFSHVFNGDMRLNMRLMGVLYGILVLGILGYYLLYSASFARGRRGNERGAMLALAIGLIAIGFAGTFFGGLIKAAVSRQREYLADASAVQFTRNPGGIAGALKRIGGLNSGSKVENPAAGEVSHAFFARAVSGFMRGLSATHPPLPERIRRIDPHWDGKFDFSDPTAPAQEAEQTAESEARPRRAAAGQAAAVAAGAAAADVMSAIEQIGNPQPQAVDYARSLLAGLPAAVKQAAREPYGARAVLYCLALDRGPEVRGRQLKRLQEHADPDVYALTCKLLPETDELDIKYRLPMIDFAIPALKELSLEQYRSFRANLVALVEMDARVDLLEWSLQKIVLNHLDAQFFGAAPVKARYSRPAQVKKEIAIVLSALAYAGARSRHDAEGAFAAAAGALGSGELELLPENQVRVADLELALGKLEQLQPSAKSRLLKACAAGVAHDQKASAAEVELLRAFADVLDCPMPPLAGVTVVENRRDGNPSPSERP